ncbi:MAG: tRNA pseudouridine(55) synthase TruB [SAR86 cluster bacterium]|uniref:tRNA pseudouridine synthase B n=1 Tax=SAR86 cluster bacterium TaxID=2030880 RepID=A0A520MC58_9GAMM|nr:MAG: tRNA pseudouridine(55) synthase TruB [SAR86 cluster bacterium]
MDGFFLLNKEKGVSSNFVVQGIKKKFNFKKVGHLGTLDPMATGLLIIAVNKATKFSSYFLNEIKAYSAEVTLGGSTDTDDAEGDFLYQKDINLSSKKVLTSLNSFLGDSLQQPPSYSALKHKGKPLYKYAREGKIIVKPPREITIFSIENTNFKTPLLSFDITCSKGTYIRAIARDIGELLGCGGYLSKLERIEQGCFSIKSAKCIDKISKDHIITIKEAFPNLDSLSLNREETKIYTNGGIVTSLHGKKKICKIFSDINQFIGLGEVGDKGLKLKQLV